MGKAAAVGREVREKVAWAAADWGAAARGREVLGRAAVGLAMVGRGMGAAGCKQDKPPAVIRWSDMCTAALMLLCVDRCWQGCLLHCLPQRSAAQLSAAAPGAGRWWIGW